MSGFLKGKKLWRIITGDVCKPVPATTESAATDSAAKYIDRLEDWDSKNYQIITWLRNTSITSISLQFGRFQLESASSPAKAIWDFLQERYQTTGLAHQYQLLSHLHRMRQENTQTINDFLSQLYYVWDQLALSEPPWPHTEDAALFTTYRDQQRLVQFLMALTPRFEPVRASLLHRTPLPTLEQAVSELLSEETRFGTLHPHPVDSVLATPQIRSSPSPQRSTTCNYCHNRNLPSTHLLVHCPVRLCRFCNKTGPGHLQQDCFRNPTRASRHGPSTGNFSRSNSHRSGTPFKNMPAPRTAAAASEDSPSSVPVDPSTPVFSHTDVEAMFQHFWQHSGTPPSTALSTTAGNTSWYFDSACCNHMTFDPTIFTPLYSTPHVPSIHTADGSLLSDPRTRQTLGIGRKQGRLYEVIHLHVPDSSQITAPTTTTTAPSLSHFQLWHYRLGHLSVGRLKSLISSGHLGTVRPNKMAVLNENIGIYLTLLEPSFSLPLVQKIFGEKPLSLLLTLSIVSLHRSFIITLHMSVYMAPVPLTTPFGFLALPVLFFSNLMNVPNLNLVLAFVASWGMVLNIKGIAVGILSPSVSVSLVMWSFGNIQCFPPSLNSVYPFPHPLCLPPLSMPDSLETSLPTGLSQAPASSDGPALAPSDSSPPLLLVVASLADSSLHLHTFFTPSFPFVPFGCKYIKHTELIFALSISLNFLYK
ncbi:hypothetical protein CsSME_00033547 [Camellia sinensis var. sinensis]